MQLHKEGNDLFYNGASKIFNTMFGPLDIEVFNMLAEWINEATPGDFRIISNILREAPNNIVFEYKINFTIRKLLN